MTETNKEAVIEAAPTADIVRDDAAAQIEDANPKKRPREDEDDDDDDATTGSNDDTPDSKRARDTNTENDQDGQDAAAAETPDQKPLSKNQQRKQRRLQQRLERKSYQKLQRREKKRVKSVSRQEERVKKAEALIMARQAADGDPDFDMDAALQQIKREEALANAKPYTPAPVPVAIIIDCDFEQYMHEGELVSLAGQITRSYAMNRSGRYVSHLLVSSWGGKLRERFETTLRNTHRHWRGTRFVEGDFVEAGKVAFDIMTGPKGGKLCAALGGGQELGEEKQDGPSQQEADQQPDKDDDTNQNTPTTTTFSPTSIIYLSADSPHTLDKLEPNTSYVIGGLVDRNREKNLCQRRAEARGIRTAKLPIGKYLQMASRQVLTTNHVVEIMAKWLETGDWSEAFMAVIPKRKGGQLKGEEEEADGGGDDAAGEKEDADVSKTGEDGEQGVESAGAGAAKAES